MKRWICFIMALLMMTFSALALAEETKQATITLEGTEEIITLARFNGTKGYILWYDVERMAPIPAGNSSEADRISPIGVEGITLSIDLQKDTDLGTATDGLKAQLLQNGYAASGSVEPLSVPYSYQGVSGQKEGMHITAYLIETPNGIYTLAAQYPSEAAEGWGVRLQAVIATFESTVGNG